MINLCLALSMYCLPEGEFLEREKRPVSFVAGERRRVRLHNDRIVAFLGQCSTSSFATGDENEIVEEKDASIFLQARRRLKCD